MDNVMYVQYYKHTCTQYLASISKREKQKQQPNANNPTQDPDLSWMRIVLQ